MSPVGVDASSEHLAHAAELERRDNAAARELQTVLELAERASVIRARANEIRDALVRLPDELVDVHARRQEIEVEVAGARAELVAADARVAELESSRRRKDDELERARSEAATAHEQLSDAEAQLERLEVHAGELRLQETALRAEAADLRRAAADVATDIRRLARVAEAAAAEPGATLDDLEEWGARVRSALFVARGTLETERERIVVEANALGTAVLGENLGGSSVAVIRSRLEESLG
jgi:chromosome segregation ATPase